MTTKESVEFISKLTEPIRKKAVRLDWIERNVKSGTMNDAKEFKHYTYRFVKFAGHKMHIMTVSVNLEDCTIVVRRLEAKSNELQPELSCHLSDPDGINNITRMIE